MAELKLAINRIIAPPNNNLAPAYNSDSSSNGTITGAINGINAAFMLSEAPAVPSSLILMVNGKVQYAYAFSNATVVLETPPNPGDVITAVYQIQATTW